MSTQFVETDNGRYSFEKVALYHGRGKIDREISFENLCLAKRVLDRHELKFGLIFGTLLGVVREGNFIEWDEDVDIYMMYEDRKRLFNALWDLRSAGLELVRYENGLCSLMRRNDYIDIYLFKRVGFFRKCGPDSIKEKYLKFKHTVNFNGVSFFVPDDAETLLCELYGLDWRTPKRNSPAKAHGPIRSAVHFLKRNFPILAIPLIYIKKILKL
ncbi:LicD family protein [Paragemmobacter aquarius]|nr:LicD family protein [Gemmobacter aquarius]